jgi:spore maturation protein CgeB
VNIVVFCHSLMSDWNHGNAHFLRGIVAELEERGHHVRVYEPEDGWSRTNLVEQQGPGAIAGVMTALPWLESTTYDLVTFDVAKAVDRADLVLVHEWNSPALVAAVGRESARTGYRALFHDTHHRAATRPEEMARYDLSGYDGVLAFGAVIRDLYIERAWADRAWTWHEAADTRVFHPLTAECPRRELVWIGNWGDGERTRELHELLLDPVARLGLRADAYGVRYPAEAKAALSDCGIEYRGWVANHEVPRVFAQHDVTLHVPRRPYVEALPGIPTIRPFEAMACGIPLVSAEWDDCEGLFRPGEDYLVAADGKEMERHLHDVLNDETLAASLRESGLETILARHTCAHRVDELLAICAELGLEAAA